MGWTRGWKYLPPGRNVVSWDYSVGRSFEHSCAPGITSLTVFNMSIFMLAEFITMGTLFEVYVGSVGYPIIVAVGLLTLTYTTFGGLLVRESFQPEETLALNPTSSSTFSPASSS